MAKAKKPKSKPVKKNGYKIIYEGDFRKGKVDVHGRQKYNRRPRTIVVSSHETKAEVMKAWKKYPYRKNSRYQIIDVSKYKITKDRLFGIKLKRRK